MYSKRQRLRFAQLAESKLSAEDRIFDYLSLNKRDFPRRLIGSRGGDLLIVATGRCVYRDLEGIPEPSQVMTVNDIGQHWPGRIDHWYSSDIEKLVAWHAARRREYMSEWGGGALHSCAHRPEPEYAAVNHWPIGGGGGSGVKAVAVALMLGYTDITVAGMPFDDNGHYWNAPAGHRLSRGRLWSNFTAETPDALLENYLPLFKGKVRFLSGRGKEMMERG